MRRIVPFVPAAITLLLRRQQEYDYSYDFISKAKGITR